ncbi:MAG: transposase [Akkermansiaceae bacterium]|nr:transposase [Akkermansiaceae bacterium]
MRLEPLTGGEFVKRYLRHVLPRGLRAVRYHGFCHPAAKAKRERIAFPTGRPLPIGAATDGYPKATPRRHLFLLRRADEKTLLSPPRVAFGPRATHSETLMRLTLHSPSFQHTGFLRNLATGNGRSGLAGGIFTVPA